jgi:hypothetical protein
MMVTRRDFINANLLAGITATFGGTVRGEFMNAENVKTNADLIIINGKIATQNERREFAESIAIKDGKFIAVGREREVMRYKGDKTQVINANKRTIVPGLNDSHTHPIRGGLNYNMELRWDGVDSLADALNMLKTQAVNTPGFYFASVRPRIFKWRGVESSRLYQGHAKPSGRRDRA